MPRYKITWWQMSARYKNTLVVEYIRSIDNVFTGKVHYANINLDILIPDVLECL